MKKKRGEKHARVGKKETEERRARPCWIVSAIFGDEKKGGIGARFVKTRFEEDHVKSDSSREGSTYGHVRAERARLVPAAVEKERAARLPSPYPRDPPVFSSSSCSVSWGTEGHSFMHAFPECNARASVSGTRMELLEGARAEGYGGEDNASTTTRISAGPEKRRTEKYTGCNNILRMYYSYCRKFVKRKNIGYYHNTYKICSY